MSTDTILHWESTSFSELTLETLYTVLKLRQTVFVVEQNCCYLDLDDLDQHSAHLLAWRNDQLLAYARCLPPGLCYPESSIGRVIVAPTGRGKDLGSELVQRGIDYNLANWPGTGIRIGAQAHLQGFYGALGFVAEGDSYIEDGIPHIHMIYCR